MPYTQMQKKKKRHTSVSNLAFYKALQPLQICPESLNS